MIKDDVLPQLLEKGRKSRCDGECNENERTSLHAEDDARACDAERRLEIEPKYGNLNVLRNRAASEDSAAEVEANLNITNQ